MATIVKTTFQLKRGTAAKWAKLNLVLAAGEPGFEIDTKRLKVGDGTRPWLDLPYIGENEVVNAATRYDFPETGAANIIYKAEDEKLLYQWNSSTQVYEVLGEGGEIDTELSASSMNAIANSAVTKALQDLEAKITSVPSYSFGEGIKIEEIDGIQIISIDTDFIHQLIPEIDLSGYLTENDLAGLATEEFVLRKIAEAQLSQEQVDLSNYYTKEETYSKDEVNSALSSITHFSAEVVESTDEMISDKVLYLIHDETATGDDKYNEYLLIGGIPILIGDTSTDLTGYATTKALEEGLSKKVDSTVLDSYYTKSEIDASIDAIKSRLTPLEIIKDQHETKITIIEGKLGSLESADAEINTTLGTIQGEVTSLKSEDARLAALIQGNTTALDDKADKTALQTLSENVYTKAEVDTLLQNVDLSTVNAAIAANTQAIIDEQTRATSAEASLIGRIDALAGEDKDKTIRVIASEEVAKVVDSAPEAFDTLKEIATWIENDQTNSAAMAEKIAAHSTILAGFGGEDQPSDVKTFVESSIAAVKCDLPIATLEAIGGIKAAAATIDNAVQVAEDGIASVARVNVNSLVQTEDETIVLYGGKA